MQPNFTTLAEEVSTIARNAGNAILDIYNNATDFGVIQKTDDSPLTLADQASNEVIVDGLQALNFQAPIISEENKQVAYAERKDYGYFWLVDPLDGTKEFIKRNGEFTVNIALVKGNTVVFGVVYVPVVKQLFWAAIEQGAYRKEENEHTQLQVASFSMQDAGLKVVASRSHLNPETQSFVDQLNAPELVSKGSSLKLLLVASGQAHLYPRLAPTMEWDTAAAQIIVEEAGGKVVQAANGQQVIYNKENLLNPHFIVSGEQK